jgi:hypothetical protein
MRGNAVTKFKLVSTFLFVSLLIIASCNKSNQQPVSPQLLLLENTWKLDSSYYLFSNGQEHSLLVFNGSTGYSLTCNFLPNGKMIINSVNGTTGETASYTNLYSLINDSTFNCTIQGDSPLPYRIKTLTTHSLIYTRPGDPYEGTELFSYNR